MLWTAIGIGGIWVAVVLINRRKYAASSLAFKRGVRVRC